MGASGILQVSEFTIDSFETEDNILITAIKDSGEPIDEDIAEKLFMLNAKINENIAEIKNESIATAKRTRKSNNHYGKYC